MRKLFQVVCGLVLLMPLCIQAQITFKEESEKLELVTSDLEAFIDCEGQLDINDIRKLNGFKTGVLPRYFRGSECTHWIKMKVENRSAQRWLLEHVDPNIERLTCWVFDEDGKQVSKEVSGVANSFNERSIQHFNIVFDIPYANGQGGTVYLKIQSKKPFEYSFQLVRQDEFVNYSFKEYCFLGIFYGCLVLMVLYNILLFITTSDRLYLHYVFYVAFSGFFVCGSELAFQFIWPTVPTINQYVSVVSLCLLVVFFYFYSSKFLELKQTRKNILLMVLGLVLIQIAVEFFFLGTDVYLFSLMGLFGLVLYYSIIKYKREGYKPARFLIIGSGAVLVGFITNTLMGKGVIASNVITVYMLNIAMVVELGAFSVALGNRIKHITQEKEEKNRLAIEHLKENERLKDQLNTKLEGLVRQRTEELMKANEEVTRLNNLLKLDNEELKLNLVESKKNLLLHEAVSFDEFVEAYPNDEACFEFLANMKWEGKEHSCKKCGNKKYFEGRVKHSRRCTKCGFDETPVMFTLFSNVRFQPLKALYILYFYIQSEEKITSAELSRLLVMRQKTVWSFIQKIKERMQLVENKTVKSKKSESLIWTDYILNK